jgi:putative tryptophan/tyrosine transport system substrate-binding protein
MKRRTFIAGLGAAAAWPLVARGQQGERVRRIGVLMPFGEIDPLRRIDGLRQGLAELGWAEGRNLRIDFRWDPRTAEQLHSFAEDLVDLKPDVLVATTIRVVRAIQQLTQTIPIIFIGAGDPLESGVVTSLSHPGGNTTGVTDIYRSIAGKWLELLKECKPELANVALVFNSDLSSPDAVATYEMHAVMAGSQLGVPVIKMGVRDVADIEREVAKFAATPNGGLITLPPPLPNAQREAVDGLAVRYRLPTIYQDRELAIAGGLLAYGSDLLDIFRHAGPAYIDRVLRGEKPGDLPVQFPTKFTLTVNLKTAKTIGLVIPESFLLRADELIE